MEKIISLTKLQSRIFFKNKVLIIVSILFPIIFSTFFSLIFTNYDDVNKIPIAVIDNDNSNLSEEVIHNLKENNSINATLTDLDKAMSLIKSNRIEAIFIFKNGFERLITTSEYEQSISVLYLDKSAVGPALGDIVASDIMTSLSIYKAANTAVEYNKQYNLNSNDIYNKTVATGELFVKESLFEMKTDITILTPSSDIINDINMDRILKTNITFGFTLIILSFVILFANGHIIEPYNVNTTKQLISYGYKTYDLYLGNILSIFITGSLIVFGQLIFFIVGLKIYNIVSILTLLIILLLHLLFLSNFVVLFTSLLKNKVKYQSIIAPILFLLGLLGGAFWSVEFLSKDIRWVSYLSPIYWSLKVMNGTILGQQGLNVPTIILLYSLFIILLTAISTILYNLFIRQLRSTS